MRRSFLLLAALLLSTPTWAEDYSMADTWLDQIIMTPLLTGEARIDAKLVETAQIGALSIVFEETAMADVASALGAELRRSGEAGEARQWLCLADRLATLWLYSDGEMGQGLVMAVALEEGDNHADAAGCAQVDMLPPVTFGTLLTGQPVDVVQAALGAAEINPAGWFAYQSITPSPLGGSFKTWQTLAYAQGEDSKITSVVVMQQSSD